MIPGSFLTLFLPTMPYFQVFLSQLAASIKFLNLNFEESKTMPNCQGPPYFLYLIPSLVFSLSSLPLTCSWPSIAFCWGSKRSSLSPSAFYHLLCEQPHLKSYLTTANSSKESLFPKEAKSRTTEIPSSCPWPLNPKKSVLFDLCFDGWNYTFVHISESVTFHSNRLVRGGSNEECRGN